MGSSKRVTLSTIAERAGVSKAAASFALNDRPGVSAETRDRVLRIARELNWRPHQAARALSGARVGAVGFVVNRPARTLGTEAFFAELVAGIQSGLQDSRTALNLILAADLEQELQTYRDWWNGQQVDAVILIDPQRDDPRPGELADLGLPAVTIGSRPSPPGTAPTIWIDDTQAANTLFGYLRAIGHRRIAFVGGRPEFEHTQLRADALAECAAEHRLDDTTTITTDFSEAQTVAAVRSLLAQTRPPTAIVFDNDVMALAGLRAAHEMGHEVPRTLSIASFDDSVMARLTRPSVTALTRDTFSVGQLAAVTVLAQLASPVPLPSAPGPAPQLSVRESTKPLPPVIDA